MLEKNTLHRIQGRILLAGAGKMGSAMLGGWLAHGLEPRCIAVIEPSPSAEITALAASGIEINPDPAGIGAIEALVVAVKPQSFPQAAARLRQFVSHSTAVVSIMAGIRIVALREACGGAVIRAMPNTPAAIGRGITVAVPAADVDSGQRELADALLSALGVVEWVDDEGLMDAVTAVSGSGPAYVFLFAEELTRAGIEAGLPEALAARLACETVAGAGELLHRSKLPPDTLRRNVTSPGGTTAAALDVLTGEPGLRNLMIRATAAAVRRSQELAG
ncbi:MAG: pyrroline-5-carboxylate reductase [Alphaproteobacteria bacterium]|nr:pyrroline-5-carboxylate reductase [Alphaproteobacteria bacterium]